MIPDCLTAMALPALAALLAFRRTRLSASEIRTDGEGDANRRGGVPSRDSEPAREREAPRDWPEWPFPPMGPVLEEIRADGERLAGASSFNLSGNVWGKMSMLARAAFGTRDPRVWASENREARCLLEMEETEGALLSSARALIGLNGSVWEGALDSGDFPRGDRPRADREAEALAAEAEFAERTHRRAQGAVDGPRGTGIPDEWAAAYAVRGKRGRTPDFKDFFGDIFGDGEVPGPGAAGCPARRRGGGWDDPWQSASRPGRLQSLRGEHERAAARHGSGSRAAAAARYRLALVMAGERGTGADFRHPDVPEGELEEARRLCDGLPEALAGAAGGGPGPLDALRLRADICFRTGRRRKARAIRRKALRTARETLGEEHRLTLLLTADFAESLVTRSTDKAASLLYPAARGLEKVLGVTHPETLAAKVALSEIFHDTGESADAAAILIMTATDVESERGRDDFGAVSLRGMAGRFLMSACDFEAAAGILGKAAASARRAAGEASEWTQRIVDLQCQSLLGLKDWDSAASAAAAARRAVDALKAPELYRDWKLNVFLAVALRNLGDAHLHMLDPAGARRVFADERFAWSLAQGPSSRHALEALSREADAAGAAGDLKAALMLHREAARLRAEVLGMKDKQLLESLEALKSLLMP
ncbi:MAG: hypothetical protein LBQ79_14150 [Deltaproteobacteria bacterium]|jgi:hypothetical protein|nr:hypothetical protein [Deltaproteobacteria bacterium]